MCEFIQISPTYLFMLPSNLLFGVCLLVLLSCRQERTQLYCIQELSHRDSMYLKHDFGIDGPARFRDTTFQMPSISSYDTVYWYRASGGWGEFDQLCAIYNQDGGWNSDLIYQEGRYGNRCIKISKTASQNTLLSLRHLIDSLGVRCLPHRIDTIGIPEEKLSYSSDAPNYDFIIKEGRNTWYHHWGNVCDPCEQSESKTVREMFYIAHQMMLMPSGYPPPKLYCAVARERDSIIFEYFHASQDYFQIRQSVVLLDSAEIPQVQGIATLKLPKNRASEAGRVRARVELINGTVLLLPPTPNK